MGENPTEAPSGRYEEEATSLGKYVFVLAARWRVIILGAILAAGAGGALILAQRLLVPTYQAWADVAIVRTTPTVSIDDKLRTGPGSPATTRRVSGRSFASRRAAFMGLVRNGDIARIVAERLDEQLGEHSEAELLDKIEAELVTLGIQSTKNMSDLIRITAAGDSPKKAAALADIWAEEYVRMVNRIFEQAPSDLSTAVRAELSKARKDYYAAQNDLEKLITSSKTDDLARRIEEKSAFLDQWARSRTNMLNTNYNALNRLVSILTAAHGLRAQIRNGGETSTASNALAILLLKAEAYTRLGAEAHTPRIEIDLGNVGAMHADTTDQSADVDALIAALQSQIERTRRMITRQYRHAAPYGRSPDGEPDQGSLGENSSRARDAEAAPAPQGALLSYLPGPEGRSNAPDENLLPGFIMKLEEEIRLLKAEKEREERKIMELSSRRDVLFSAFNSLQSELVELSLVRGAAVTAEIRLASSATLPDTPRGPSPILASALSGVAGLFAMACFVLLAHSRDAWSLSQKRRKERLD